MIRPALRDSHRHAPFFAQSAPYTHTAKKKPQTAFAIWGFV